MAVTQSPFSMNRWIPFFRTVNDNIFFSTNEHSVVCDHASFVFLGTLKKEVTNPATKFCSRDKPMFALNKMRCAQQHWIKKSKFHWAMSILSRISSTIASIHWCFSTSTTSCKKSKCIWSTMLRFNHLFTCSSRNKCKPPDSKPRSARQKPVNDCKMQKRGAKKINLQSSVDQKFRSPLCNVSSHAHIWVHPIFKTCLRFNCDLYVCIVKLGMLTNLPHLGNHQYACHTAESDYRTNRFGIPLNRRRILFFVRLPTDSTSERKNVDVLQSSLPYPN